MTDTALSLCYDCLTTYADVTEHRPRFESDVMCKVRKHVKFLYKKKKSFFTNTENMRTGSEALA